MGGNQLFHLVEGAVDGYSGAMKSKAESAQERPRGRAWLDALPAQAAKEASAALAALPAEAASAGAHVPLAIAAWTLADPAVAANMLEEWLAQAAENGNLEPACPVACQLAERVVEAWPDSEARISRLLPALGKILTRAFARFDAGGTGLPRWTSAAEALIPAAFAPGRFTVDLAVLLSNEAAAFCRLAAGCAELDPACGDAEGEQRELDVWLKQTFWNEEVSAFDRLDDGAESRPDFSACGFFPLVWEERTEAMSAGLRPRAAEMDPSDWPPRAWILFFALLLKTPHNSVVAQMRRRGLPAGAAPIEQAAWTVLALGADAARATYLEAIPPTARWLDAHGRALMRGALACGAALLVVLLGRGIVQRENRVGDVGDLERRARIAAEEGEHARAAALYGKAARRGNAAYFRYRQGGEWMRLEQYADAEAAYRDVLARAPDAPNARMNLALAVLKQGRREEALELYRAFAADPASASLPELAARARLAAELVGRQLALDRE